LQFWTMGFSSQRFSADAAILAYCKTGGNRCGGKVLSKTV